MGSIRKQKAQEKAYGFMKEQIESGIWLDDFRVLEQAIADELEISRTPIREAINTLIEEGYLDKTPNRGVVVKKKIIEDKEFLERTQLLETLLSHYIFQLQIKHVSFDILDYDACLLKYHFSETPQLKKEYLNELWVLFLKETDNRIIKQTIILNMNQLLFVDFPNTTLSFFHEQTKKLFDSMLEHLTKKQYELARKDIRVFFNRLNLELIDQQF